MIKQLIVESNETKNQKKRMFKGLMFRSYINDLF